MFQSISNDFCPKEAAFNFLSLTYNKRSRKTDLALGHRYPNYEIIILYADTDINCGKFQGDQLVGV